MNNKIVFLEKSEGDFCIYNLLTNMDTKYELLLHQLKIVQFLDSFSIEVFCITSQHLASYPDIHIGVHVPCQEYERAVIFRLGLLLTGGTRGPGVFFILPCVDVFEKIDMRTQTFNVPPQEVHNVHIDIIDNDIKRSKVKENLLFLSDPDQGQCDGLRECYHVLQGGEDVEFATLLCVFMFEVKDAISAVINVDDYGDSARLLAATTLRNVLGTKNLGEILSDREAIANDMQVLGAENILPCGENI